jgi:hypothetical protein
MFVLGFVSGLLWALCTFVFVTWKKPTIERVIQRVEDTLGETGGFIEPMDKNKKMAHELKVMLEEK